MKRLRHLDTPATLQIKLGTFNVWIGESEALRQLSGTEPVLLAVEAPGKFPRLFGAEAPPLRKVFETPGLSVYSNTQ